MNIEFAAKGVNLSDALKERVEHKLEKIEQRFGQSLFVRAKFSEAASSQYACGIHFNVSGHEFVANTESDDLYKASDEAMHKIERQVRKMQNKIEATRGDSIRGEAP